MKDHVRRLKAERADVPQRDYGIMTTFIKNFVIKAGESQVYYLFICNKNYFRNLSLVGGFRKDVTHCRRPIPLRAKRPQPFATNRQNGRNFCKCQKMTLLRSALLCVGQAERSD